MKIELRNGENRMVGEKREMKGGCRAWHGRQLWEQSSDRLVRS